MMKKLLLLLLFIIAQFPMFSTHKEKILVLHSYKPNYVWTSNINDGIEDTIHANNLDIELTVEYMNVTAAKSNNLYPMLYSIYNEKYENTNFSAIIISDNYALNFIKQYRKELWNEIPIIFCGINGYKPELISDFPYISGVIENVAVEDTVNIALSQNPNVKNILIWSLDHKNANINRELAIKIIKEYDPSINVINGKGVALDRGLEEYKNLNKNDLILLFSILRDSENNSVPADKTATLISNMSNAPVYVLHDIFFGYGVIGGKLVSGYSQGQSAAEYVVKILKGENVKNLDVIKDSPNKYMFDDTVLFKFSIPNSEIPFGSILTNSRPSLYRRYIILINTIVFILVILIFTFLARFSFKYRRQLLIERHLIEQRSSLFDISGDLLCITSKTGYFKQVNPSWFRILGWTDEELKKEKVTHFVHPDDLERTRDNLYSVLEGQPLRNFQIRYSCKDGSNIWLSWDSYHSSHGDHDIFAVARDITDEKRHNEQLEHLAAYDELTAIYNRRSILHSLDLEMQRSRRYNLKLGILMIDIDKFKDFNDKYGHQTGDRILKLTANICQSALRAADSIGRYGGEEFIIILPESNKEAALIVAERVRKAVGLAELPDKLYVTISVGVTTFQGDINSKYMIERADKALYLSKNTGRNRVSYE